ncbi:hypothetical protein [Hymenobacter sp. PAMC 26628]|uniref:hypothetical protein n=1 Tax=Hymenobacter sp. PAMC 26628 TaxID=1484118 RepID=UPI000770393E|nr:hypothetical protein [Hymenobacter sp. PAMC 26628]AMJ64473.1 hypothetical protein AXW84_02790 [Hymenobacter sp. PAMC 26628]
MVALKRFVSVVVMVYLLLALLFIMVPAVRNQIADLGTALSQVERERDFFQMLATIGAVILAVHLVVENLDSSILRRNVAKQDGRINELKAKLYDHQQTSQPLATGPLGTPANRYEAPTAAPEPERPLFPQNDPGLPNTPSAERPRL